VVFILNAGFVVNHYLRFNRSFSVVKFLHSSLILVVLVILLLGLISGYFWLFQIGMFASIVLVIIYFAILHKIYKIDTIGSIVASIILHGLVIFSAIAIDHIGDIVFENFDFLWFVCITVLLPIYADEIELTTEEKILN